MAESNASKQQVRSNSIEEDDPLLELSRIIGFDSPKYPLEQHSDEKASAATGDLSLDLERELFGTYQSEPPVQASDVGQGGSERHHDRHSRDGADEFARVTSNAAPGHGPVELSPDPAAQMPSPSTVRENAVRAERDGGEAPKVPEFLTVRRSASAVRQQSAQEPQPSGPPANIEDELARILGGDEPKAQRLVPTSSPRPDTRAWHEHAFGRATSFGTAGQSAQARTGGPQRAAETPASIVPPSSGAIPANSGATEQVVPSQATDDHSSFWDEILPDTESEAPDGPVTDSVAEHSSAGAWHYEEEASPDEVRAGDAAAGVLGPAVDTTQVPERSVEPTAPLELPDFDFAEPAGQSGSLDDLESEFAEVFATLDVEHDRHAGRKVTPSVDSGEDEFYARAYHQDQHDPRQQQDVRPSAPEIPTRTSVESHSHDGDFDEPRSHPLGWGEQQVEESAFDLYDDDLGVTPAEEPMPVRRRGRGFELAAAIIGVLVLGAVGAFAFSFFSGPSKPSAVVVHADDQPIKVKPNDPGGVTVPNQDKAVYARADGAPAPAPEQKTLVDNTETPLALPAPATADTKSDARIDPSMTEDGTPPMQPETLAMTPRQVRTVIVKPDGTIVRPEQNEASNAATNDAAGQVNSSTPMSADAQGTAKQQGRQSDAGAPVIASLQQPAEDQKPLAPVSVPQQAETALAPAAPSVDEKSAMPTSIVTPHSGSQGGQAGPSSVVLDESAGAKTRMPSAGKTPVPVAPPVVPSRPAVQPMTVIGSTGGSQAETKPQQVASAATAGAAAGGYAVQIASQPTAEAAQKTYDNLARRYSQVLAGRGVDIQRADITGKGTYYRVRVPAASKDDAIAICTQYKSAGGSCYVTH